MKQLWTPLPQMRGDRKTMNQPAQRKPLFLFNSLMVVWVKLIHYCNPHVWAHPQSQAHSTRECWGRGRLFCNYLFIPVPSLIGLWASESPVGIFKLGHRSDQSQNKQWLEENLQKSADLHYSHSQPWPPPPFPWKTPLLVPNQVVPPSWGHCFLLLCEFLASDNGTTRDTVEAGEMPFCFTKSLLLCPQSLAYSLLAYIHFGNMYMERWMCQAKAWSPFFIFFRAHQVLNHISIALLPPPSTPQLADFSNKLWPQ